jgi:hypothetical protein
LPWSASCTPEYAPGARRRHIEKIVANIEKKDELVAGGFNQPAWVVYVRL